MLAEPLNERPGDALKDLTPLLPEENERGLEKLRNVFGVEKVRVGLEKLRDRNALVDPERNVLALNRFTLNRFTLDDPMFERFALNRVTLGDVIRERLVLNRFTLDRFTLDDPMFERFTLNRFRLGDVMFERFTLNLFTLDDATLAPLVVLPILLSADILVR
jgi:hypothetical protein